MEIIRGGEEVNRAIDSMAGYITHLMEGSSKWQIVGIADGAIPLTESLAQRVQESTGQPVPTGTVNVSFHRDDIGRRPITDPKSPTRFPFDVDGANIILVDDVIHSGRTIRAAMDELFEHGRPALLKLVTLVDRLNRSLPIQPDFSAMMLELEPEQKLSVLVNPHDEKGNQILAK